MVNPIKLGDLLQSGKTPSEIQAMEELANPEYLASLPEAVYACALCRDLGWHAVSATDARWTRCSCLLERERLAFSGALDDIFPVYRGLSFDSYAPQNDSQRDALTLCRDFAESYPEIEKGILLAGGVGIGKTCLLYCTLKSILTHTKFNFERFTTSVLFSRLRSTFNAVRGGENEYQIVHHLVNLDVLVLDDLGVEKESEWTDSIMFAILDGRCEKRKPTLATSNLQGQDLDDRLGRRLASRKHQLFNVQELYGTDRRTKQ